jgi:hypothetical protein
MNNKKNTAPAINPARVSISPGNTKMGHIPSVSLPPVITCAHGCACAKKCYAAKLCRLYKNTRDAYARNLDILRDDPVSYWLQVEAAAMTTRFFRYHVSGDIPGADYLAHMVDLARRQPATEFLAFTKKYSLVNDFLTRDEIPANLHVIFSAWPGMNMENPHALPVAAVIFKGEEPRDGWKVCPGNCADCAARGVGCWELKPGETIAFYEH